MYSFPPITRPFALGGPAAAVALLAVMACAKGQDAADSVANAAASVPAAAASDSGTGMSGMSASGNMQGMPGMSGNADQDFLRMMSDHHKGLIALAHLTKDRRQGTAVADAKKLDAAQDAELDHMVTMLETDFKDAYSPRVLPAHQAMVDQLKTKSGVDYDRAFYQNVIAHHQEAVTMIDGYLPRAKNAMLKPMAEKMKADQSKEIADFKLKLGKLGA